MVLLLAVALAFTATALLIPLLASLSLRVGFVDVPNARKMHDRPVPLVGGLAICTGVVAALVVGGLLEHEVLPVVLASVAVVILGILDDRFDLRSTYRLLVQIGLALALCRAGVRFHLGAGAGVDWTLTVLWVVGTINAFNCLDCVDGAAGVTALVAFLYFGATGIQYGRLFVAQLAFAGAAAVVAFLLYNRPRARVFLGDTGSTFLGLILASLSLIAGPKPGAAPQIPWPALALLVPFYDLILVHARRYQGGMRSVRDLLASTGKDHMPHRLLDAGLGSWGAVGALGLLAALPAVSVWLFAHHHGLAGGLYAVLLAGLLWRLDWAGSAVFAPFRRPAPAAEAVFAEPHA